MKLRDCFILAFRLIDTVALWYGEIIWYMIDQYLITFSIHLKALLESK